MKLLSVCVFLSKILGFQTPIFIMMIGGILIFLLWCFRIWPFRKTKADRIKIRKEKWQRKLNLSLETLLSEDRFNYKWNYQQTMDILTRHNSPIKIVKLYNFALRTNNHSGLLKKEILCAIESQLKIEFDIWIGFEVKKEIRDLKNLFLAFQALPNSANLELITMLGKRTEAMWLKLVSGEFETIRSRQYVPVRAKEMKLHYEKLFTLTNMDWPISLEIAKEINKL